MSYKCEQGEKRVRSWKPGKRGVIATCMAFSYLVRLIPRFELKSIFHNSIIKIILNRIAVPLIDTRDDLTRQVLRPYTESLPRR